jgi:hypothetical protein
MVRDLRLPMGRVDRLELGDLVVPRPLVGFSQYTSGILTATEFDGVIGGELLRRFRVVYDYPGGAVFLEPTAALHAPFEHDMSGMFLIEDPEVRHRFLVHDVLEGSPASEAGLKIEDTVLSIDGVSAKQLSLDQVRSRLVGDGRVVRLAVRRGDETMRVILRLRRLI